MPDENNTDRTDPPAPSGDTGEPPDFDGLRKALRNERQQRKSLEAELATATQRRQRRRHPSRRRPAPGRTRRGARSSDGTSRRPR